MSAQYRVAFYSGSRGDETPLRITADGRRWEITRVIRIVTIGGTTPESQSYREFIVESADGGTWRIAESFEISSGWKVERLLL